MLLHFSDRMGEIRDMMQQMIDRLGPQRAEGDEGQPGDGDREGEEVREGARLMICDRPARVGDVVFCRSPYWMRCDFVGMVEGVGWGNFEGKLKVFPMSHFQAQPRQEMVEMRLCTRHTPITPHQ